MYATACNNTICQRIHSVLESGGRATTRRILFHLSHVGDRIVTAGFTIAIVLVSCAVFGNELPVVDEMLEVGEIVCIEASVVIFSLASLRGLRADAPGWARVW